MAKVSASVELILDAMKCSSENKKGVVMADGHRVGDGASCSEVKESPCVMLPLSQDPRGRRALRRTGLAWFLMSQMAGALHPRAHCRQMAVLNSLFVLRLIIHGDIFYILLYPCLYLSQAPGVTWPGFTSLTRH